MRRKRREEEEGERGGGGRPQLSPLLRLFPDVPQTPPALEPRSSPTLVLFSFLPSFFK